MEVYKIFFTPSMIIDGAKQSYILMAAEDDVDVKSKFEHSFDCYAISRIEPCKPYIPKRTCISEKSGHPGKLIEKLSRVRLIEKLLYPQKIAKYIHSKSPKLFIESDLDEYEIERKIKDLEIDIDDAIERVWDDGHAV